MLSKLKKILLPTLILPFVFFSTGSKAVNPYGACIVDSAKVNIVDKKPSQDTTKAKKAANNELKSAVKYKSSDSSSFDIHNQTLYLYGNAEINYEAINLKAAVIEVNYDKQVLFAKGITDSTGKKIGEPEFTENGKKFKSHEMRYNFKTKKGKIANVVTQEGDGYIHGETVKRNSETNFYIRSGKYTTCNLDTPHYYLAASKLKVIQNDKIVTGPAYLVIEGVPTPLFIPFGFFPSKKGRSSGIVIPAVGESSQFGFALEGGGYYFGISDRIDLLLTGSIYSKGNWRTSLTSNYRTIYRYNGSLQLNYSFTKFGDKELPSYSVSKDYNLKWEHHVDPKARPNSNFSASVNAGSSSFTANNIAVSTNDYLSTQLSSSINYSKSFPGKPFNFSIGATHNQVKKTKSINVSLPTANFNMSTLPIFGATNKAGEAKWYNRISIAYNTELRNQLNTYDSIFFTRKSIDNLQYGMKHNATISAPLRVLKFLNLTNSVNARERFFFNSVRYKDAVNKKGTYTKTTVVDGVTYHELRDTIYKNFIEQISEHGFKQAYDYDFNSSFSTTVYGMLNFKKGYLKAIRHVMTPNVGFSYRPDFGTSQYGYYQNVKIDTAGHTQLLSKYANGLYDTPGAGRYGALNFGLNNSLEMKVRVKTDSGVVDKKIKLLESLSFNSSYNLLADSLRLAPIGVSARTTLFDKLGINASATFNPYAADSFGRSINKWQWNKNHGLSRMTNASLSSTFNFNKKATQNKPVVKGSEQEQAIIKAHPEEYVDFDIPWNISMSYNINYVNSFVVAGTVPPVTISQTIGVSGDLNLTPKWKIVASSGYDFTNKDFTFTRLSIFRDLHCWEMKLEWTPFGLHQSYFFQINVKSSVLQDLKLMRRNPPQIRP